LLGTIEYSNGRARSAAALTTPDPPQIAHLFADMAKQRASHCVMEISSHALDQRRCAALPLAVAAITNITRDHFDYHGDVRNYRTAKSRIADLLQPGAPLLIGVDDPGCRAVLDLLPSSTNVTTFGFTETAQTRVELTSATPRSQTLRMHLKSGTVEFISSLVGRHNALNLLTAAAMAEQLGMDLPIIADSLSAVTEIPGRMERIDLGQPFTILVDYAHTPDGITHCLATARALTPGRVILVFGAGGDRDRDKRPLMAQAASPADSIIVTSDNPRSESPTKIIDEICQGFASLDHVQTCVDRNLAIQMAAKMAQPGDVVVIAGRGHESIQQIGTRSISFDDRKVTRRILRELQASRSDSEHRVPNAVPA
jgi:UDP-N-acetylmuramoyl-L-alanyl-D-glutamate--2,6-diaminopimelate ligase